MSRDYIMKELDYAGTVLEGGAITYSAYTTALAVAKYFKQNGLSEKDMLGEMIQFILSYLKMDYGESYALANIVCGRLHKSPIIDIDCISISTTEMSVLQSVYNFQTQKLLFTMLCLAKYFDIIEEKNNHWTNASMSDIIELANVRCNIDRVGTLMSDAYDRGVVTLNKRFIKVNNRVNFIDNSDDVYKIYKMRDLGKQYNALISGKQFVFCERCDGVVMKTSSRLRTKYCPACAKIINREKSLSRYFASRYYPA